MKKHKKTLIILGSTIGTVAVIWGLLTIFVFHFPKVKNNAGAKDLKENKWYRIDVNDGKSSDGSEWYGYIKRGSENKLMIYFQGGGVSVNEYTAANKFYNKKMWGNDWFMNLNTNIGIGNTNKNNPFKDWTVVVVPYTTGDFHVGTGEYAYHDDGNDHILYHNGYNNYQSLMNKVSSMFEAPEEILVTGFSAGGFGTSLLANDVLTNYYNDVPNKTVLVDSSLLLYDGWKNTAENVWKAPSQISERLVSDNITLDSLLALSKDHPDAKILFDCSVRDGELAKYQNYLDTDNWVATKESGEIFQNNLKNMVDGIKNQIPNSAVYIWDGIEYDEQGMNLTHHTIINLPNAYKDDFGNDETIAEWAMDAVNGQLHNYGENLLN
ncbi:putative vtpJ-therm [Lachnospiraceae bacterium TWA4]|nr:putative vtpJ-therm [Lachnospiraceae bacterium TWA4]